jgi:hypothetical protein
MKLVKMGRHCPEFDIWIRQKSCCMDERRAYYDEDHRQYVRPKRNPNHLPDSWDTRFIHREKSWKNRARKKKQYIPHMCTVTEWKWVRGITTWWNTDNRGRCLSTDPDVDTRFKIPPVHDRWPWRRKSKHADINHGLIKDEPEYLSEW